MSKDDGGAFCGVPERLATQMTWNWKRGELEFHFHGSRDERAMLLELSDWLEGDGNAYRLAQWMQRYEASFRTG